ncbi:ABC transporter permease [Sabulicella rubraurantiaca]|uniref:ABC transporter permease n=1 Tax=Sabulicella rubraurantiaca TaxID=2811429 RepID=UPI001A9747D2|nr:ABC transporter permease [Sabulicella rubraurantiaca]
MSLAAGVALPPRGRRLPWVALTVVALTILVAASAGWIAPHDPEAIDPINATLPPVFLDGGTSDYLLGTDRLGRDILSRILHGARLSLGVAAVALALGGSVGTLLGLIAGYRGGWADALIMRLADTFLAFPSVLIALVLAVTVGPGFWVVALVLGLVLWARFARLVRGEVLSWKARDFVALARVAGAGGPYIVLHHILPNIVNSLVVLCTLQVGWAIVVEASLTFLGAGIPPPAPTWGGMVAEGLDFIETAWWISVMPGVAILVVVFAFNLLGDWLRDWLDPQLRSV